MHTSSSPPALAVAVDGTSDARAMLMWAAEEAERKHRPLLLAHAAGHLPPELTYAERHSARAQLKARGEQLLADAAAFVHRLVPSVEVTTAVRLLRPDALPPAIASHAVAVAGVSPAWQNRPPSSGRVIAAVRDIAADASVVQFATEYAARRGVDLELVEGSGVDVSKRVLESSAGTSLVLLALPRTPNGRPGHTWPETLEISRRSTSPVVLVTDRARPRDHRMR